MTRFNKSSINERISYLRKSELQISLEKFSEIIQMSKTFVSQMEIPNQSISEQTIEIICREFNISENWLRYGEGTIFSTDFIIKKMNELRENGKLTDAITYGYTTLDPEMREMIMNEMKNMIAARQKKD